MNQQGRRGDQKQPGALGRADGSAPPAGDMPHPVSRREIEVLRIRRTVDEVVLPPTGRHLILISSGRPFRLEERLDGRRFATAGVKGDVALIPAGSTAEFRTRERAPQLVESLAVALDPVYVESIAVAAGIAPDVIQLIGVLGGRDPLIEQIGLAMLAGSDGDGLGELYAERLAGTLAAHLLRNHSLIGRRNSLTDPSVPARGLSATQLARVTDYIVSNLDRRLPLAELATVAGISPFHFSRMFKLATDLSPHQFVLARRAERALELLRTTELPLADVAHRAGFADQSHLAKVTKRLFGTSPAALRHRTA